MSKLDGLLPDYPLLAAPHLPTNGPRNLLTQAGLRDPSTGEPISDALALGISGGLGCGYILWQFKGRIGTVLTIGFTWRWNYGTEAPTNLLTRLGATPRWVETGSRKKSAKAVADALAEGKAAVVWLDQVHLGYLRQPTHLEGCFGWHGTVCGSTEDGVLLHDLGEHPRLVSHAVLEDARARIGSYKNRLLAVESFSEPSQEQWAAAVRAGVADTTDYLSSSSASFSIPAIKKWARMVVDAKNKKGWRKAFVDGQGLASALESTWSNLSLGLSDGTGLRRTYARFCREGAEVADWPALAEVAPLWDAAADAWATVAETALPSDVGGLSELRALAQKRRDLLLEPASPEVDAELDQTAADLMACRDRLDLAYPEPEAAREARLDALSAALHAVVAAETAAVAAMKDIN